jgi:hypothetical protein
MRAPRSSAIAQDPSHISFKNISTAAPAQNSGRMSYMSSERPLEPRAEPGLEHTDEKGGWPSDFPYIVISLHDTLNARGEWLLFSAHDFEVSSTQRCGVILRRWHPSLLLFTTTGYTNMTNQHWPLRGHAVSGGMFCPGIGH